MTVSVELYKSGGRSLLTTDFVTLRVVDDKTGLASVATLTAGEWAQLIAKPKATSL